MDSVSAADLLCGAIEVRFSDAQHIELGLYSEIHCPLISEVVVHVLVPGYNHRTVFLTRRSLVSRRYMRDISIE